MSFAKKAFMIIKIIKASYTIIFFLLENYQVNKMILYNQLLNIILILSFQYLIIH